jgi:hypothetical protein
MNQPRQELHTEPARIKVCEGIGDLLLFAPCPVNLGSNSRGYHGGHMPRMSHFSILSFDAITWKMLRLCDYCKWCEPKEGRELRQAVENFPLFG